MSNRVDMSKLHYVAWLNSGGSRRMSREDQFKGFGRAVIMRLLALREGWIDFNEWDKDEIEEYGAIIADAAYLLAYYVLEMAEIDLCGGIPGEILEKVPDMPVLPGDETSVYGEAEQ